MSTLTLAKAFCTIKARLIALDETENWSLDQCPYAEHIERIEGVYLYDANQSTYCCSMIPDRWLQEIDNRAIFKPGVEDRDDIQSIYDAVDDWIYSGSSEDGSNYFSQWSIDSLFESLLTEKFRALELGNYPIDERADGETEEEKYDAVFEAIREHCQCNAQI